MCLVRVWADESLNLDPYKANSRLIWFGDGRLSVWARRDISLEIRPNAYELIAEAGARGDPFLPILNAVCGFIIINNSSSTTHSLTLEYRRGGASAI